LIGSRRRGFGLRQRRNRRKFRGFGFH
jgi:hypothetical protein